MYVYFINPLLIPIGSLPIDSSWEPPYRSLSGAFLFIPLDTCCNTRRDLAAPAMLALPRRCQGAAKAMWQLLGSYKKLHGIIGHISEIIGHM